MQNNLNDFKVEIMVRFSGSEKGYCWGKGEGV